MAVVAGKNWYTETQVGLLKSNFAHRFCAQDFADIESLRSCGEALLLGAHDFLDDRIHFVPQIIECSPVRILDQDHDVEILRPGGFAVQDFVIEDDLLLFLLVVNRLHGLGDLFKVFIAQTSFGFYHCQRPDWALVIRCAAPFGARRVWRCEASESNWQQCSDN